MWACSCHILERRKRHLNKERLNERIKDKKSYIIERNTFIKLMEDFYEEDKNIKKKDVKLREKLFETYRYLWIMETEKKLKEELIVTSSHNSRGDFIYSRKFDDIDKGAEERKSGRDKEVKKTSERFKSGENKRINFEKLEKLIRLEIKFPYIYIYIYRE
jgi:hypothetical protein